MRRTDTRTMGAALALALGGLTACADDLPTAVDAPTPLALRPSLRVAPLGPTEERPHWRPPENGNGVFLLPKACDVWIGEPEEADPGEEPMKYPFQIVIAVPTEARVKLVAPNSPEFNRWEREAIAKTASALPGDRYVPFSQIVEQGGGLIAVDLYDAATNQFICDPTDPVDQTYRVVDPVTDHAAKGDGPKLVTQGVILDLAGHGIRTKDGTEGLLPMFGLVDDDENGVPDRDPVTGALLEGEPYDNMGVVLMGSGNQLVNSVTTHVAHFSGWGHALEMEGENLTIAGRLISGDVLEGTGVFNIETAGGLGARLSTGNNLIRFVKSVDHESTELDEDTGLPVPVGVGFEVRRCPVASTIRILNSHFEGSGEGAIIRECGEGSPDEDWGGDVTFQGNYVSSPTGIGLNTRETTGGRGSTILIRNNVIDQQGTGSHAIEWTRETTGLTITGNVIRGLPAGACAVFNEGRDTGGFPRPADLIATNTLTNADGSAVTVAQLQSCGIPINGGTPGQPPPPPPPPPVNVAPTATIAVTCTGMTCTIAMTADDSDGSIASYNLNYDDGTSTGVVTGAPPDTLIHTYSSINTVRPSVTVTDDDGATFTATSESRQLASNPEHQILAVITATCTGQMCSFDASASSAALAGATIETYDWYYRAGSDADTYIRTTRASTTNFNLGTHGFQPYRVRVKVTDSRGVSRYAAINNVTPVKLTIAKGTGNFNQAANRRPTLTWEGPPANVSIFFGTVNEANLAWWGNRAGTVNADGSRSFRMPNMSDIPRGTPLWYQVCLPNSEQQPIFCSAPAFMQY